MAADVFIPTVSTSIVSVRYIDASRRLKWLSALALQSESDLTPSKPSNLKMETEVKALV